jgi:hypothetical protein
MMNDHEIQSIKNEQEKHEFHFVIARSMREKLKELNVFKNPMSFSGIVAKIPSVLQPVVKVEHKWGEQRMSKYLYVSNNPDEKRDHVHAYLDENVYRELKLIHQDLNFYSISQIVRMFLDFFLELVEEHGENTLRYLKLTYKRWKEDADDFRLTYREEVRQLCRILPMIKGGHGHLSLYDDNFTPFSIFRL